ncbi:MAG: hypothetical protein NXY59_03170 [Aigarchaeota archaeon]|nr:hypothetical protein [Candidatus Pelearchaeum maunauluense]
MPDSYPPRLYVEPPRRGIPVVEDVYFAKDGLRISQSRVGERVEVHIFIRAEGGDLSGEITIRIRRDIALGADEDYIVKTVTINVPEGRRAHITLTFIPNQRSGGTFRGLFLQIDLTS